MLKLKLQYSGHLVQRIDSFEKTWCWERLKAGQEGDNRGWDGWMASLTQWTWVWINSGSWWWTGRPGVLQSVGLQIVGHDRVTELNWTELNTLLAIGPQSLTRDLYIQWYHRFYPALDSPIILRNVSVTLSSLLPKSDEGAPRLGTSFMNHGLLQGRQEALVIDLSLTWLSHSSVCDLPCFWGGFSAIIMLPRWR